MSDHPQPMSAERQAELEQRRDGVTDPTAMHPTPDLLERMRAGDFDGVRERHRQIKEKTGP